ATEADRPDDEAAYSPTERGATRTVAGQGASRRELSQLNPIWLLSADVAAGSITSLPVENAGTAIPVPEGALLRIQNIATGNQVLCRLGAEETDSITTITVEDPDVDDDPVTLEEDLAEGSGIYWEA